MQSRGVLYMVASAFAFSLMGALVKIAAPRLPIGEIVFMRLVVTLVISYLMLRRAGIAPWGTDRRRLTVRGLYGSVGLAGYFVSLAHLPLADAVTLHFTHPIATALLAWWLLGERVGWVVVFAIACGCAGVLLVVHPGVPLGAGADSIGVAAALIAAMFSAAAYVSVRQLSQTEHPLVIVFYFPLIATPLSIPWALYDFEVPSAIEWLLLIAIGVTTQVGQVFLTKGLAAERAGRAMSVFYVQICFAVGWQILIFGQQPELGTLLGAAIIIAGTLAVTWTAKPDAAPVRTPT